MKAGSVSKLNSIEYDLLDRWIAQGLKSDLASAPKLEQIEVLPSASVLIEPVTNLQLHVVAKYSNQTERDVTSLAVYDTSNPLAKVSHDGLVERQGIGESTVLVRYLQCQEPVRVAFVPARPGFKWTGVAANSYIDEQIFNKLRALRMNPSELCSDEVFLRRAYLDLLGLLPTPDEAHEFLLPGGRDDILSRRSALIDCLLQRSEFADFWALKWADLLRVEAHSLDQKAWSIFMAGFAMALPRTNRSINSCVN